MIQSLHTQAIFYMSIEYWEICKKGSSVIQQHSSKEKYYSGKETTREDGQDGNEHWGYPYGHNR